MEGTSELALRDFQQVLKIDPLFGPTYYNLALYYRSLGDIPQAYSCMQKARALNAAGRTP